MRKRILCAAVLLSSVLCPLSSEAQPLAINFQGRLTLGTNLVNGVTNLSLRIFDASSGGSLLYEDSNAVAVVDGLYSTLIGDNTTAGSLTNALANTNAHLEVMVGGTALSPRERIASVAYAVRSERSTIAASVDDGAITVAKLAANAVDGSKISDGSISNADLAAGSVNGAVVADGSLTGSDVSDGSISNADLAANTFWSSTGNSGTIVGTHFLGATDYTSVEVRVNNARVARFEPATNAGGAMVPNVILGHSANFASNGTAFGSAIGGGGNAAPDNAQIVGKAYDTVAGGVGNKATGGDSTVAGGRRNVASALGSFVGGGFSNVASGNNSVIGGGSNNTASGVRSTVAGGFANTASGLHSFVGGGSNNTASADDSTVGGGNSNRASGLQATVGGGHNSTAGGHASFVAGGVNSALGDHSTVSGGENNSATGRWSTVAGGSANFAGGEYSLAAGRRAKANHDGAFVWADNTDADFASTSSNQFLIRAGGGVIISGSLSATSISGNGAGITNVANI